MERSLIIHLTGLSNGEQLNGKEQMTEGDLAQALIVWEGNCHGTIFLVVIVLGAMISRATIKGGGGGNCPERNCPGGIVLFQY